MINAVHYLIRSPHDKRGFIYPSDLEAKTYYATGGLFLLSAKVRAQPEWKYNIWAVLGSNLIQLSLERSSHGGNFFSCSVETIGKFIFYARSLPYEYVYSGAESKMKELYVIKRLQSWRPEQLNRVCRERGFYFVGYSPMVRG
jgi:hypothetical protein